jgi:hypothetical protein
MKPSEQTRKFFSGAGRKRQLGVREPNGRLSRAVQKAVDARTSNEIRRLRDACILGMRDPMWGTELGRLLLGGKIEPEHFEAGRRWANLVAAWRQQHVGPPISPKGCLANLSGEPRGVASDRTDDPEAVQRAVEIGGELKGAFAAIKDAPEGRFALRVLQDCCEMNRAVVLVSDLASLKIGLAALSEYWAIK